jgi:hypothetical protein
LASTSSPARGGWIVLELNGAVEFTADYARWHDVFAQATGAIASTIRARAHDDLRSQLLTA